MFTFLLEDSLVSPNQSGFKTAISHTNYWDQLSSGEKLWKFCNVHFAEIT